MAFPDPGLYPRRALSRWCLVALVGLAGCVSPIGSISGGRPEISRSRPLVAPPPAPSPAPPRSFQPERPLQCVPYARLRSGIAIYGDARTWWDQAAGRYPRASIPQVGAVLVLGGTPGGHVAVVSAIVSEREILVDHANWANDGAVHLNAPVRDVSENGDWSAVRVWHLASGRLGARIYPARGFVLPVPNDSAAPSSALGAKP
jgi:hypothetical protein